MSNLDAGRSNGNAINVALVDDHRVVRDGLRSFLERTGGFRVVGEAADGGAGIELVDRLLFERRDLHVVLMDIVMRPVDGVAATREIKERHPGVDVIAVTAFPEETRVVDVLEAGATGFLLKDAAPDELAEAIHAARRGEIHIDPAVSRALMGKLRDPTARDPLADLTGREREVLVLVAQGYANKQIARDLQISERTARTHVSNILAKLDLHSRTQAALFAVRNGLVRV